MKYHKCCIGCKSASHTSKRFVWCASLTFALVSACSLESATCGNGALDNDEVCDGGILNYGAACSAGMYLPEGASLGCNADCSLNTDACVLAQSTVPCGNGVLDAGELCDAEKFSRNVSCPKGSHLPEGARLRCNADCSLNTDACVKDDEPIVEPPKTCGNDRLDEGEVCDGNIISQTASCPKGMHLPEGSHLPEGARLRCNADCSLNTDACVQDDEPIVESPDTCGNGSLDNGEECDGSIISKTASCPKGMHLPDGKSFACQENCTLDTSDCEITISTTIPQGRVVPNKEYAADLTEIPLHRTPQHVFPNKDLYVDHDGEPSQIVTNVPKDAVIDIIGFVGHKSLKEFDKYSKLLVQYNGEEGYIHAMHVNQVNDLEIPRLNYSSPSTNNYYQKDEKWKDVQVGTVGTIEKVGGVPVSIANAIASFKGSSITPNVIADTIDTYLGKSSDYICQLVKNEYQFDCEYLDNKKGMNGGDNTTNDATTRQNAKTKMQEAFKNGWYVVAEEGCGESTYWGNKRTILVYGYDKENDRVYVDDPQNRHYMEDKGIESFLNCNHTMSIIKNTKCVPKTCEELNEKCGEFPDGCGGTVKCTSCTAQGTVIHPENKAVMCRRSPQKRNLSVDLQNNEHDGGLAWKPAEAPQSVAVIETTIKEEDRTYNLLAKIDNPKNKLKDNQIWYLVKIDNEYCFLPSEYLTLKTNGVEIPDYKWSSGSTNNYLQQNSDWASIKFFHDPDEDYISKSGCGISSLANAISALTGDNNVTPKVTAEKYTNYRTAESDPNKRFCVVAGDYNLNCEVKNTNCGRQPSYCSNAEINNGITPESVRKAEKDLLITTFQKGGYVLALQYKGYWTDHSHWITVYGYDQERNIIFADDPMNRKYMQDIEGLLDNNMLMIAITPK